jgi:uncharacterized membrane protein YfcA
MAMPPETLIAVALVIFVGYTVFGATGFGASPITIPVLAHVLPLTFVLPLAALLDLGSGLVLGFHTRRQADSRELLTLVPFTLIGLTLGVTLLVSLPRGATVLALGLFVCVYALYVMFRRGPARPLSRYWAAPAGLLGGIVGALFGMGGPPYVVYISGRIPDPAAQRATISQMVILNVGLRVVAFALAGGEAFRLAEDAQETVAHRRFAALALKNRGLRLDQIHAVVSPALSFEICGELCADLLHV